MSIKKIEFGTTGGKTVYEYTVSKLGIDKKDIMPGDILCYSGHIAIYGGRGKQYDAGNKQMLQNEAPVKVSWGMNMSKVLRAPNL